MGRHPMCVVVWSGILHGLQVLDLCAWTAGDVSVSVLRGLNAKLPCDISNAQDVSRLSIVWSLTATVGDGRPTQVILYQGGTVTFSPWGTGARARFVGDPRRSGSVVIEGAQRDDAGLYQCITVNPARQHQPRIHTVRLNVLEVPSPPQCVMRGEEELGATMLLICDSSSGNPAPTYSWWKVDSSGNQILNNSHTSSGILLIQNLSVDSSGVYLCIASNVLASESCSMTLTLEIFQDSVGSMAAGIGITLVMAVIILTLFGLVLWLHSKRAGQRPGRRAAAAQAASPRQPWQPDRERSLRRSGRTL